MEYYGLDIHKLSITYTCMNEQGEILRRGRVETTPEAIRGIVAPSGERAWVALEATRGWSYVYDTLQPLGVEFFLAHPKRVKAIATAKVKTDAIDSATLAHLLRTRLLPVSYAPPPSVRSWREMLRTRQGLVRMRSACRHRIHSILGKEGLIVPVTDLFGKKGRRWLADQGLSCSHRQLVDLLSSQVDSITLAIREVEESLRQSLEEHPVLARLMTVPGLGFLTAAAFLAEVGDVDRFPRARHLVSYLGLAPRVRSSGGHTRIGSLTKEGPPLIRSYLIEVVQNAVRSPGPCQDLYLRVKERSGSQSARVAVARKLAVLAYLAWKFPKEVASRE